MNAGDISSVAFSVSGVPARVAFFGNANPDKIFLGFVHEDPFSDLGNGATASTTDVIEGCRADCYAGGVGTFRRGILHSKDFTGKVTRQLQNSHPVTLFNNQTMRFSGSYKQTSLVASIFAASFA